MKLIIVRHGETHENLSRILIGHGPGKLTDLGIEQAKKAGLRLKDEKIDMIYVSDLERTCVTAEQILQHHRGVPVIYTKELRERHFGVWEGKPLDQFKKYVNGRYINTYEQQIEGGESRTQLTRRMIAFCNTLLEKHKHQTILLVTHGGPMTLFYLHLFEKSIEEYEQYHPKNAAITILEISDDKKHTVHVLNCVKHLN